MENKELNFDTEISWPENLIYDIFGEEEYNDWKACIPSDFNDALKYVLEETMPQQEAYILYAYYRDSIPLRIIGQHLGVNYQNCYQQKRRALFRLRFWTRTPYLRYGLAEGGTQVQERRLQQQKLNEDMGSDLEKVLHLNIRIRHSLSRAHIYLIKDLTCLTEAQLLRIRNIGDTALAEIKEKLAENGLSLKQVT